MGGVDPVIRFRDRFLPLIDVALIMGFSEQPMNPTEGVAVVATGMWPALKGREALKVTWDDSAAEKRGSPELIAEYRKLARQPGTVAGSHGDAEAALVIDPPA